MKKVNLNSLKLNKKSISNLKDDIQGGAVFASDSPSRCGMCTHTCKCNKE